MDTNLILIWVHVGRFYCLKMSGHGSASNAGEQTEEIISLDFVVLEKHVEVEDEAQNLIY